MIEERLKTPVAAHYDVAVCGGGFAGIAAALAAARGGKKTVLFERQYMLGGLGTAGLIAIYLPLCDGYGHQVSFGIAEELIRLAVRHNADDEYPINWFDGIGTRTEKDERFAACYNPQLFAVTVEELLADAGVDILYGTYAVGVKMNGDKISHIITENKSGRRAYEVGAVIDASGDCDIAAFAGAPTANFNQGNLLAAWYAVCDKGGYRLNALGAADIPDEEKTVENEVQKLAERRFGGTDGVELAEMMYLAHREIYADFLKKKKANPEISLATLPTIPQVRMTRRLVGEYTLSHEETHKCFEDSVGMVADWKKRGPVYEVPFGTLYNPRVKNLLAAGRCTSVTETMWDIMRVIPCCAVTGEAAGTAAALCNDFSRIDITKLQNKLKANRVVLHEDELD